MAGEKNKGLPPGIFGEKSPFVNPLGPKLRAGVFLKFPALGEFGKKGAKMDSQGWVFSKGGSF